MGVLGFPMWSLQWIKEIVLPNVAKGLSRSGRERKDIEIRAAVTVAITNDKKQGYRDSRGTPGFYTTIRTYQPLVNWHGYEEETEKIREAFVKLQGFGDEVLEPVTDEMVGHVRGGRDCGRGSGEDCRIRRDMRRGRPVSAAQLHPARGARRI